MFYNDFRKKKRVRFIAAFMAVNMIAQIVSPTIALALTSGPSQPEMQSFEPAGTSDMVDLFSGDFNYNIPLFDLPGPNGSYPFNIAYHGGIGMDQEASWVGLGWNINPGAINRDKRGLPDDFNGDAITSELDMASNFTYGATASGSLEIWGGEPSKGTLGIGLSIYNNSFKGVGYSLDPSISRTTDNSSLGFGLSFDSQEGIGANSSIAFGNNLKDKRDNLTLGGGLNVGFNSKRGLSLTGFGFISNTDHSSSNVAALNLSTGSTYSFAEKSFMPAFSVPMAGSNQLYSFKIGWDAGGSYATIGQSGFYREERVSTTSQTFKGYGYNYLEGATANNSLMDFNREKDAVVRKETPNLPSPVLTFDTYTALGQGFLGGFRAHRNDIGHLHDPYIQSSISGKSIGVEFGVGSPFHLGFDRVTNVTETSSGDWTSGNLLVGGTGANYTYTDGSDVINTTYNNDAYEKVYYKTKDESAAFDTNELDYIGGELAVRADLDRQGSLDAAYYATTDSRLQPSHGAAITGTAILNRRDDGRGRINRNNSIQPITNELLLNAAQSEMVGEYKTSYYNSPALLSNDHFSASLQAYSRSANPVAHNAGFSCVNASGQRYVYALPAYNKSEEEIAFSILASNYSLDENTNVLSSVQNLDAGGVYQYGNTDKFKSRTVTPAYAHAYLLTSVLGADYVDLTGNGPTEDDYGYWVKFNYVKTTDTYSWRTPFTGAYYSRGKNNASYDDKAMFNYGTKEVWNLASAETKTHIAVFKLSVRKDGMGTTSVKYAPAIDATKPLYKVDEIKLFSKADYALATPVPLKVVHFDYTYDLCGNVPNNSHTSEGTQYYSGIDRNVNAGKLTLKKIWFTYQNNSRGQLSPYVFDYHERVTVGGAINTAENPNFGYDNYDRWGGYKPAADYFRSKNLPYVSQFDPAVAQTQPVKDAYKTNMDTYASVWCLKQITLPTGGSITVDYEADDYAYVQNRQATQMFQISKLALSGALSTVYDNTWLSTDQNKRRVYFTLESPIPDDANAAQTLYKNYISGLRQADGSLQMYFRVHSVLRDAIIKETVAGYCNIESYGFDAAVGGYFTTGYVVPALMDGANTAISQKGKINYHPFAVAAWQYMRTTQPELLTAAGKLDQNPAGSAAMDKAVKVKNLLSVFPALAQTFVGYRKYAFDRRWADKIELAKSFIRLATPDKYKFGGGHRVKRITYNDNWASSTSSAESSNTYGQVYSYTATEGTTTVSSGVAQYEPLIGGDEIALRHPKTYTQTIPLFTDNNLFYEYPVNESYYPGASVGYSKVTVQSIAASNASGSNGPTTGVVEYQYYTAKDYPVITDETENLTRPVNFWLPIPLLGEITANKLYASQGYSITLNNMHGKLKSITNYAKDINGGINPVPVSSVAYQYNSTTKNYDGQVVNVLNNTVKTVINESVDANSKMVCNPIAGQSSIIGEEYDFFTDSRQSSVESSVNGLALNTEIVFPTFTIPCPWPSMSRTTKNLNTFVTNKVIYKSGILTKTIATDGTSTVTTENKVFDARTGMPLLTTVTNDFDKPVYSYDHPAYWEYDGMGASAKNFNYTFYTNVSSPNTVNNTFQIDLNNVSRNSDLTLAPYKITPVNFYNTIAEGDEFIIQNVATGTKNLATLITKQTTYNSSCVAANSLVFYSSATSSLASGTKVKFNIVHSGRRNNLSANVGTIAALKDPTDVANRGVYASTSSGIPFNVEASAFVQDLVVLINSLIYFDTGINKHILPTTQIDFTSGVYSTMCPYLKSKIISVNISHPSVFYYFTFSYLKDDGTCATQGYNIAHYSNSGVVNDLLNASGSGNSLYLNYVSGGGNGTPMDPPFLTTYKYTTYVDDVISSSSALYNSFWDYDGLASIQSPAVGQTNLYAIGKKGIWKPALNYYYKDERLNQLLTADVQIKHDGIYKGTGTIAGKNEFYLFNWQPKLDRPVPVQWMPNSVAAMYDQNSNTVETRDIVSIPTSVQYGYSGNLPVIQAKNATRQEIYFQGFEETLPFYNGDQTGAGSYLNPLANIPHTGKKSYPVSSTVSVGPTVNLNAGLKLIAGQQYTISLWVSQNNQPATYANTGDDVAVKLVFYNAAGAPLTQPPNVPPTPDFFIRPSGNVIETWQRIEGNFIVPAGTVSVGIYFQTNLDGVGTVITNYFDDIRIFPSQSNVSTSVYDANNYRISAVLDANNFATFYNYNEEGKLFLVKKETTDGIKTIKEERAHIKQ